MDALLDLYIYLTPGDIYFDDVTLKKNRPLTQHTTQQKPKRKRGVLTLSKSRPLPRAHDATPCLSRSPNRKIENRKSKIPLFVKTRRPFTTRFALHPLTPYD